MSIKPESVGSSIVLRGSFNPAILQPAWMASLDILKKEEADATEIEVIHQEVTILRLDSIGLNVNKGRFELATVQESDFPRIRDLTLGIFEVLSQTPVRSLGLNWQYNFRMASDAKWHELGFRLAPKEPWNEIFDEDQQAGMRSLTIEGRRKDGRSGFVRIRVEPSPLVDHGLFIDVNDHYVLDESPGAGTSQVTDILADSWSGSFRWAQDKAGKILGLV